MGTSYAHAQGFNREAVKEFFEMSEAKMRKANYPPDRIFNVNETGLIIMQPSDERCATRIYWQSSSIWLDPTNFFTEWFKHFIEKTNPTDVSSILLILDGHYSHTRNLDVLEMVREKLVTIVYDIAELFSRAYLESTKGEIAVNGFRTTGIYSFNLQFFTEDDILGEIIREPESNLVLPQDIQRIPGVKTKTSNRGRNATTAKVLTCSPYKNQLHESLRKAKSRARRRSLQRSRDDREGDASSSNRYPRDVISSSSYDNEEVIETDLSKCDENDCLSVVPENSDKICTFCDTSYSSDRRGEE
ncbi:hypothetical protein PV325_009476 [Microctonus aethiopoides]|nr:hypothetical protein PV325_009476 [Microctonus aethiopoides]